MKFENTRHLNLQIIAIPESVSIDDQVRTLVEDTDQSLTERQVSEIGKGEHYL